VKIADGLRRPVQPQIRHSAKVSTTILWVFDGAVADRRRIISARATSARGAPIGCSSNAAAASVAAAEANDATPLIDAGERGGGGNIFYKRQRI